jgi:hypothetical protein
MYKKPINKLCKKLSLLFCSILLKKKLPHKNTHFIQTTPIFVKLKGSMKEKGQPQGIAPT